MVVADSAILHGQNRASNRCGTLHGDGCALARVGDRMGTLTWVPGTYLLQKWKCNYQGHEDLSAFPARDGGDEDGPRSGFQGGWIGLGCMLRPSFPCPSRYITEAILPRRPPGSGPRNGGTRDCAPSLTPTRILVHTHKVALHLPLKKVWSHKPTQARGPPSSHSPPSTRETEDKSQGSQGPESMDPCLRACC